LTSLILTVTESKNQLDTAGTYDTIM